MQRLGRNAAVGIRSSATMKSDAAWNAGHRAAWPKVKQGSVVLLIGSLVSAGAIPFYLNHLRNCILGRNNRCRLPCISMANSCRLQTRPASIEKPYRISQRHRHLNLRKTAKRSCE
ncbi:SdpI family protein [Enteractinococcus helveticum]|uniref:SdpI family protein n=1 Tax=Enteractinococcus helveticum TaxID=1837282 RepID=UPI00389961BC